MNQLDRYATDWDNITEEWQRLLEKEMDAAFKADDPSRYRFAARLRDQIASARRVMLESMHIGDKP